MAWEVKTANGAIQLDEDMLNYPTDDVLYRGTREGLIFTASYDQGTDYLHYVCQFHRAELSGHFSPDLSSFEAHEILSWGPAESETWVERNWVARRSAP